MANRLLIYDDNGRVTSSTTAGAATLYEYDLVGSLSKVTFPDGAWVRYIHDDARRLTDIEDHVGNRIHYELDAAGNPTSTEIRDPYNELRYTQGHVYDELSRLVQIQGADQQLTLLGYDLRNNLTSETRPSISTTAREFDKLNRLSKITDAATGVTTYGYNALGQLTSVTDPRGLSTNHTYNAFGDLIQQISPDTGTTVYTYDDAGNMLTRTDARGSTATYAYDALNRVLSLSYPDQTISYTYDSGVNQNGRLTQVTDGSGSTTWSYDTQGRPLSRQQSIGILKSVGYAYDASGRLETLHLPSGNTITYAYADGKVTSLTLNGSTAILSNILYQPFGPTQGWTWGNGSLAIREYDTDGLISGIDSAGLKTYTYDTGFRITAIADADNGALSQSYGYDSLDRAISATGTGLDQSWTYDANGNRLTQGGNQPSTYAVSGTSNRITSVTGALSRTYSYDAAGNTTGDGTATFAYNDAGRMISATKAGATTLYAINALGQRVKKTTAGTSTYFVYDEAGRLLGEYDGSGNLIQETVWFDDIPVATIRPDGGGGFDLFYIHTDHLNTPRRISRRSDNVVVWRWDSDPFGTTQTSEDPDGDSTLFGYSLRLPGQYSDAETGLYYNYFRDYEPQTGRYSESDPIGLAGGLNTYAYVGAKPLTHTDRWGLREYADTDPFVGPLSPGDYYSSEMTQTRCGRVPPAPPGADIGSNMNEASGRWNPFWFRDHVRNRGPWDYKQFGARYRDFGNFNFGATGRSFGFSVERLLREAGRAQQAAGTSRPSWGEPGWSFNPWGGQPPYGDDPDDQMQIRNGARFCECMSK